MEIAVQALRRAGPDLQRSRADVGCNTDLGRCQLPALRATDRTGPEVITALAAEAFEDGRLSKEPLEAVDEQYVEPEDDAE